MTNEEIIVRLKSIEAEVGALLRQLIEESDLLPAEEPEPAKPIKLEDVRAVLTTLSSNKGAAAVKELLADMGAAKLSEIAVQDYPELLAKAKEMAGD